MDREFLHFNYYLPWWWLSLLSRRISMISLWGSVLRRKDLSARAVITLSRYRWPCIYIRDIKNQNSVFNEYLSLKWTKYSFNIFNQCVLWPGGPVGLELYSGPCPSCCTPDIGGVALLPGAELALDGGFGTPTLGGPFGGPPVPCAPWGGPEWLPWGVWLVLPPGADGAFGLFDWPWFWGCDPLGGCTGGGTWPGG